MNIWRDYVICPYNKNHVIRNYNIQSHIPVCKEKHQSACFLTCRFNSRRLCQEDPEFLCEAIPENVSTKSKRRRDRIRKRQVRRDHRPRINEPLRKTGLNERAVEMDKKQNLWDVAGGQGAWGGLTDIWTESVKKKSTRKHAVRASNEHAERSLEAADHRSKAEKKRSKKKHKKEKGTGDNVPADKSDEKKEYVIKLNDSVAVTETNKTRREVYIHYPTRRLLSPDSVPKSGLGIQPMMLQRICFEAFMKMQYSSDGDGSGASSLVNENESKTNKFWYEAAYGDTSSLNEDENKTTQGSSETASGVIPLGNKKEIKSTQASDGKLNTDLYCPKRYKPKKDKKKWHANPKVPVPHNPAQSSSLGEFSLRDRFAKYMISETDELPPPRPCMKKYPFPPPYFESENVYVKEENEEWELPAKEVDYKIYKYLCDKEWPDEKDCQCIDDNENANDIY